MACCDRLAPALLLHVNLLLCMVAGGALSTAARLQWDPSTYVPVRALLPDEYRVAGAVLCAASAALLVLAHGAALALSLRASRPRLARFLLLTYAGCMCALVGCEAGWAAWTTRRLLAWLHSERAAPLLDLLQLRDHLRPLLAFLARYHPLPDHLNQLMEEAQRDAPRNVYVCVAALLLTALLQPAAALLALLARPPLPRPAAADTHHHHHHHHHHHSVSYSISSTDSEKAPLRTAYRNGKLVIL